MNPIAVTAIQAMVAPVVLITAAAILSGALLTMYGSVNDRMRAMDRERLDILTGAAGWPGAADPDRYSAAYAPAPAPPAAQCRPRHLHRRGRTGAERDRHRSRRDGPLRGGGDRRSGPGPGRDRDASRRPVVRCAIDHDFHGCDRLRGAARPVTRVLIATPAGACPAE